MPARGVKEDVVQRRVLALIRKAGGWAVNIHGEPMQPKTIDIIACLPAELGDMGGPRPWSVGLTLGIECKRPGGDYKRRGMYRLISNDEHQEYELQTIRDAGGWAAVVDDPAIVARAIAAWPRVCRMCLYYLGECDCD